MQDLIEHMKTAALAAGAFIKASTDTDHTDKSNRKDFVTVADIKSQDMICEELSKAYPDTLILSEEHSEKERKKLYEPDFTGFVIDPIDGTFNFKHGMKESAVSIGYIKNGQPTAGVVFDPYRDELYWSEKGKGAFCNGEPIHVSDHQDIEGASVALGNSYDDATMKRSLNRHIAIYDQTGHMPWMYCLGSGVLTMCWIARGRIDAYHVSGLKPWDNAAAFGIVREAGGRILQFNGKEAIFTSPNVLIGNSGVVTVIADNVFTKIDQSLLS